MGHGKVHGKVEGMEHRSHPAGEDVDTSAVQHLQYAVCGAHGPRGGASQRWKQYVVHGMGQFHEMMYGSCVITWLDRTH